jgi:antitoxin component of MazEF toxin-antitoxin module
VIVAKVQQHGNSLAIVVPAAIRRHLALLRGAYVQLDLAGEVLEVRRLDGQTIRAGKRTSNRGAGDLYRRGRRG